MKTGCRYAICASSAGNRRVTQGYILSPIIFATAVFASALFHLSAVAEAPRAFPGRYLVTLPGALNSSSSAITARSRRALPRGVRVSHFVSRSVAVVESVTNPISGLAVASVPLDPHDSFCKNLIASGAAESCSPDFEVKALATVNDPNYSRLYGLSAAQGMDAPRAWKLTTGSQEVVVGVVDTGIDYDHPDLIENIWRNPGEVPGNGLDDDGNGIVDDVHGFNAITNGGDPKDDNIHGTHCAGTIGAVGNNGVGVVGVNHHVRLMALKFLDRTGSGSLGNAIKAIDYAIAAKQKYNISRMVLSNSWGGGGYSQPLNDAIQRARDAGIVFVAAAGNEANDNDANPSYPASYEVDNVVSVAAVDKNGNLASFSNYGATSVDIAAAGVDILSTAPNGAYATLSGTSMATPHVSGALALLWSHDASLNYISLISRLYDSGRSLSTLYDNNSSVGLVRTQRAVDVGRMLYNETAPLPVAGDPTGCGYEFETHNLASSGESIDTAADNQPIVNQSDEGSFYAVPLKFTFPYFKGSAHAIYLSPNGVVYTKAPTGLDYQVGERAPSNAIAALHSDLTPTQAHHGVRVYSGADKVTILWTEEHYANQGKGEVQVRLTLFPNGVIKSSISFAGSGDTVALRQSILGNPFVSPEESAKALVGLSGASSAFSSTVDIGAAQRALIPSASEALVLGVTMRNGCSNGGGETGPGPVVTKISLKEQMQRKAGRNAAGSSLVGAIKGSGDGVVPLRVTINRTECQQTAQVKMTDGLVRFTSRLPKLAVKITVTASGVSRSLKMRGGQAKRAPSASRIQLMCRTVLSGMQ